MKLILVFGLLSSLAFVQTDTLDGESTMSEWAQATSVARSQLAELFSKVMPANIPISASSLMSCLDKVRMTPAIAKVKIQIFAVACAMDANRPPLSTPGIISPRSTEPK